MEVSPSKIVKIVLNQVKILYKDLGFKMGGGLGGKVKNNNNNNNKI